MQTEPKKIAVLPGDGIGPEIMAEAFKTLQRISEVFEMEFEITECLVGGAAIDETGLPLPPKTIQICEESDAILLGAVGGPKWENLPPEQRPERGALLPLRKHFGLFANLRPIKIFLGLENASPLKPHLISLLDLLFVRELLGDCYFAQPKGEGSHRAIDTMEYHLDEVQRICRYAFELAAKRRKIVHSIDKANILATGSFWRRIVTEIAAEYPEIKLSHLYVDNAAMQLVLKPKQFDVILCPNMFGDILSDLGAALTGSLGMLPSASLNPAKKFGLYEPAGGSAPDIAGKGIANPCAMILSLAMMFRYSFDCEGIARTIEEAVEKALGSVRTKDIATEEGEYDEEVGTAGMGEAIAYEIDPGLEYEGTE